jgi:hypothetical protein
MAVAIAGTVMSFGTYYVVKKVVKQGLTISNLNKA